MGKHRTAWHLLTASFMDDQVEYKSPSRPARPGVWSQLLGYAHQYLQSKDGLALDDVRKLPLFLMVHEITPTLLKDAKRMGLEIGPSGRRLRVGPKRSVSYLDNRPQHPRR